MAKIQIGGAGGAPSNGFIKSLRESGRGDYLIGTSCVVSDLFLANVDGQYAGGDYEYFGRDVRGFCLEALDNEIVG